MTQPITPDSIRIRPDEAINFVIDTINRILELDTSVADLLAGKPVEIYDSSDFILWQLGHRAAVAEFKAIGWQITERNIGPSDSRTVYYFSLPEGANGYSG